jgi:hypothetical protein
MSSQNIQQNDLETFRNSVMLFWYLEGRSWFMENPELQNKLMRVINLGLGFKVNVTAGNFEEHLDKLITKGLEEQRRVEE